MAMYASGRKIAAFALVVILVIAGWVLIALTHPTGGPSLSANFAIGLLFGTMFGQASLAAVRQGAARPTLKIS